MEMSLVPALCALAGSVIGVIGGVVCTLIIQHYETRRKTKELLIKAGMEQWAKYLDLHATSNVSGCLYSPEIYILHLLQFAGLLDGVDKLSDEEIKSRIRKATAKIKLIADTTDKAYLPADKGDGTSNTDPRSKAGDNNLI